MSENGTVARGICSKDADENLTTCVERTEIMRIDSKVSYKGPAIRSSLVIKGMKIAVELVVMPLWISTSL